MIIKIEDAPSIKHIKIDINFDDATQDVKIENSVSKADIKTEPKTEKRASIMNDIMLNTDETYEISNDVVEKPDIPDIDREAKVSNDMENLEL